jgi:hypothetical protein
MNGYSKPEFEVPILRLLQMITLTCVSQSALVPRHIGNECHIGITAILHQDLVLPIAMCHAAVQQLLPDIHI